MSPYAYAWMAWGIAGVLIETAALALRRWRRKNEKDTLSSFLEWAFTKHGATMRRLTLASWFGFAIWFSDHIWHTFGR